MHHSIPIDPPRPPSSISSPSRPRTSFPKQEDEGSPYMAQTIADSVEYSISEVMSITIGNDLETWRDGVKRKFDEKKYEPVRLAIKLSLESLCSAVRSQANVEAAMAGSLFSESENASKAESLARELKKERMQTTLLKQRIMEVTDRVRKSDMNVDVMKGQLHRRTAAMKEQRRAYLRELRLLRDQLFMRLDPQYIPSDFVTYNWDEPLEDEDGNDILDTEEEAAEKEKDALVEKMKKDFEKATKMMTMQKQDEINALTRQLEDTTKALSDRDAEWSTKLNEMEQQLTDLKLAMMDKDILLQEKDQLIMDREASMQALQEERRMMAEERQREIEARAEMEAEQERKEQEFRDRIAFLEAEQKNIEDMKQQMQQEFDRQMERLQRELTEAQEMVNGQAEQINALRQQLFQRDTENEELKQQVEKQKIDLEKRLETIRERDKEITQRKEEHATLSEEFEAAKREFAAEVERVKEEGKQAMEREVERQKAMASPAAVELEKARQEIMRLNEQVADLTAQVEERNQRIQDALVEADELRRQIDVLRAQLENIGNGGGGAAAFAGVDNALLRDQLAELQDAVNLAKGTEVQYRTSAWALVIRGFRSRMATKATASLSKELAQKMPLSFTDEQKQKYMFHKLQVFDRLEKRAEIMLDKTRVLRGQLKEERRHRWNKVLNLAVRVSMANNPSFEIDPNDSIRLPSMTLDPRDMQELLSNSRPNSRSTQMRILEQTFNPNNSHHHNNHNSYSLGSAAMSALASPTSSRRPASSTGPSYASLSPSHGASGSATRQRPSTAVPRTRASPFGASAEQQQHKGDVMSLGDIGPPSGPKKPAQFVSDLTSLFSKDGDPLHDKFVDRRMALDKRVAKPMIPASSASSAVIPDVLSPPVPAVAISPPLLSGSNQSITPTLGMSALSSRGGQASSSGASMVQNRAMGGGSYSGLHSPSAAGRPMSASASSSAAASGSSPISPQVQRLVGNRGLHDSLAGAYRSGR